MTLHDAAGADPRWIAVQRRDAGQDGHFVYAVLTTGVYCRPNCGARLPRLENVRFFATNADAERAGFRPCKRCKPESAPLAKRQASLIAVACNRIASADGAPDYNAIASETGLSRYHFHRMFKTVTGMTPGNYAKAVRARRVIAEMGDGATVTEAIYAAGYGSSSRFYEGTGAQLGVRPGAFRRGGAGETIRFAVGACSLGNILVAATDKGICTIQFGDDAQTLIDELYSLFPKADLIGDDAEFERTVASVVAFVEEPVGAFPLPLDIRGTAFQKRVWDALRAIPVGSTTTYANIAAQVGAPGAVRAVASACARNRLAVVVPCHRVVRTGGALAGYRWGIERKAALIAREAPK